MKTFNVQLGAVVGRALRLPGARPATEAVALQLRQPSRAGSPTFNVQWTKRVCAIVCAAMLCQMVPAGGEESAELRSAAAPLAGGVPEVAVVRLRELLKSSALPEEQRRAAILKLGEALVASGEAEEALDVLPAGESAEAEFWRAQALAALSRWAEALPLYEQTGAGKTSSVRAPALFGQAEAWRWLGRRDEALQTLANLFRDEGWGVRARLRSIELLLEKQDVAGASALLDATEPGNAAERKERRFLRGRLEAQLGHEERAIELWDAILKSPQGTSHSVLIATLLANAEAHLRLKRPEEGGDFLEDFIERYPQDLELPRVFAKLDQLYRAERKSQRHGLGRWANDSAQPRRSLAQWYLARAELRAGRRDVALQVFGQLREDHPGLAALAEGLLEFAQLDLEEERFDQALTSLAAARALPPTPPMLARIDLLTGRANYLSNRFAAAAQTFEQVAQASSRHAIVALYNASLAWLQEGESAKFRSAYRALSERGGPPESTGDLLLEEGLFQASQGDKKAAKSLQTFLRDFPESRRASEAWVALAELAFHDVPPRLDDARKNLERAQRAPTAAASERADYLSIWIEDAANSDAAKAVARASDFLQKHPDSSSMPEVRMKLAETYYRREDFPSAQTQFEILAQKNPAAPLAEKAQFFAADSAMQSMGKDSLDRALGLLDEVVKKNGELKWAARNQQAVIERKLGIPAAAITLYDEVLKGDAKPGEKREALCGKADILSELGGGDPENYRRAIALYDQLVAQSEGSLHWRSQALFKKGTCLEKLGARPEALATFHTILEDDGRPDRPREFFWFYKAGFNAARLLEDDSKWESAAAIYEKLAAASGARSDEAKARLSRLRLEHFLWD